ncbi:MAG TPA: hypothetical protein PKA64_02340 [Myxococcota bacterium]|nr:hypothetical protein [Myxococcota bacterium]
MKNQWLAVALIAAWSGCDGGKGGHVGDDSGDDSDSDTLPPARQWTELARGLGGALLSVTGSTADDVWMVGAEDAAGATDQVGPLFLHWDGSAWQTIDTSGHPGDLWWVWRASADDLWISGAGGRVLRYAPGTGTFTSDTVVSANYTLFGVWGASADDVWTVGSNLEAGVAGVWHWDGAAWTSVTLPAGAEGTRAIFKVNGTAADDVWFCGSSGVTLHWDGAAMTYHDTGATSDLLTISARSPTEVYASGGAGNAVLVRWDGASWSDESPDFQPTVPGVFAGGSVPIAAGYQGFVYERMNGAWTPISTGATFDFHAGWRDPDGGIWAVGGIISSIPVRAGTIWYGGSDTPVPLP